MKKKGSIFLGAYLLWKIKKYHREISNVLQALHVCRQFRYPCRLSNS